MKTLKEFLNLQKMPKIDILEDTSVGVLIATSQDVPGLVVEATTKEELITLLKELVPVLLNDNHDKKFDLNNLSFQLNESAIDVTKDSQVL